MLEAAFWGFVGGGALLVGAVIGLVATPSKRTLGLIMGFGAGVLISALAFELTLESFSQGGRDAVALGLAAGALTFYVGDWLIDRTGGEDRKRSTPPGDTLMPAALVLGALLDGIPESVAIGVSLLEGSEVGLAFVAAVFLSNIPESLSASVGMRRRGATGAHILGIWGAVAAVSALAAAVGYVALDGASGDTIAVIQAFAGGAILVMLADTMMPEAFEEGGRAVGLVTVLGFALAFLLTAG